MQISKADRSTDFFSPLEQLTLRATMSRAAWVIARDSAGHVYCRRPIKAGKPIRFARPTASLPASEEVGRFWSVRIGIHYRALAVEDGGDLVWFWIGHHAEYDRLVQR